MKDNQHEQLFTELTPAEAAVVEGGLNIRILRIHAIKAGADGPNDPDDLIFKVNGTQSGRPLSMKTGQTRTLNLPMISLGSVAQISLFDDDGRRDQFLGDFSARNTNGAVRRVTVGANGSTYQVAYRAVT